VTDLLADYVPFPPPILELFVPGTPAPQGSMKGFLAGGKVRTVASNGEKLGAWRSAVSRAIDDVYSGPVWDVPVTVVLLFVLPRPKSAPKSRVYPDRLPDIDKLSRAVLDCLTGLVIVDDARVVALDAAKAYGERTGAHVLVRPQVDR
jgi:crossover junction endodeoxyribonuclease RusA